MDLSPLAIILVKNGSRGDKLLFRYPFSTPEDSSSTNGKKKQCFSITTKSESEELEKLPIVESESKGTLPDEVMSHLFAVNNKLAGEKFELKVNDVRFVGHPVKLQKSEFNYEKGCPITLFHVVFALKAKLPYQIIQCYHELSQRISAILRYEEGRCQYLYKQSQIMLNAQEEVSQGSSNLGFEMALSLSPLAQHIKECYEQLNTMGCVDIFFHKWMHLSFCLPQRRLNCFGTYNFLTAKFLEAGFKYVKPFHTILFLADERTLLDELAPDSSPTVRRLITVHSPTSPMYSLAADADLTLGHVYQIALNMVLWGKGTIIYPVCCTNVYVLSHRTPMTKKLMDKFSKSFPELSFAATLSEYSLPISPSAMRRPLDLPEEEKLENEKLMWLLKHGLLQQFHTFVYIAPPPTEAPAAPKITNRLPTVDEVPSERSDADPFEGSQVFSSATPLSQKDQLLYETTVKKLKNRLTPSEIEMLMKCKFSHRLDDLCQFARLCKYFRGQHPLEEIMYRTKLSRCKIFDVIDKFTQILITVQQPDPSVDFLSKMNHHSSSKNG